MRLPNNMLNTLPHSTQRCDGLPQLTVISMHLGGNLASLEENYNIPEDWVRFYTAELVLALAEVHKVHTHVHLSPSTFVFVLRCF